MDLNAHQRYLIEEFADEYHERRLSRRDLLKRVLLITGSVPFTASILATLGCGPGSEQAAATTSPGATASEPPATATLPPAATPAPATPTQAAARPATGPGVSPTDPAIQAGDIRFDGPASALLAYLARPRDAARVPGVLVIHENRGLNDHIRDVARRYAKEGFAALAIDLVSRAGGTRPEANENTGFLGRSSPDDLIADSLAGLAHLRAQPYVAAGALGVTGFCLGGGYTWEAAIASADVRAAVPYYGTVRLMEQLSRTRAAILAIYGATDQRVTSQAPRVEEQLKASGRPYEVKIYPGAGHAFFNDTGANHQPAAASDAWVSTLNWFRRHLA